MTAITAFCIFLTSCSSSSDGDTYFIHASAFENTQDGYKIVVLCEKSGEKDKYFTASAYGKSLENAAKKLMKRYKDCYFATCEIYFFNENADENLICHAAKEICDSNFFPTKSNISGISSADNMAFLKTIKDEDDLKRIKNYELSDAVNTVKFFASVVSGCRISIPAFTSTEEGKMTNAESIRF